MKQRWSLNGTLGTDATLAAPWLLTELAREAAGEVVIYGQLTDKLVEAAMSAHPTRIRNMMFVGTIITDERGEAEVDSNGMFAMEDDGC